MKNINNKSLLKEITCYLIALVFCTIFLFLVMHLWAADINIPFSYGGDAIFTGASIKGMVDNGWYLSNSFIGMPAGFNSYDFPSNMNIDFLIMKIISLFSSNWAVILNIYYLLTFPLTIITTLFVLRKMRISAFLSIVGSILFTFIPFHFMRGESHLSLSAYYLLPLIVLVVLWLFEDDFLLNQYNKRSLINISKFLTWKNSLGIIFCIGIASSFVYYPFFSCYFLLVAGVCAAIALKKWTPLFNSFILIGIIILCIIVCNIPTLLYQFDNGKNIEATVRVAQESEIYGLKIIQLLLPIPGHRIPLFSFIADIYARTAPLVDENQFAALGIIGSIGFCILILWLFIQLVNKFSVIQNKVLIKLNQISMFNLAAVLLATIGGFGTIFAYWILPQIRCYNRISIFIAFLSITAIMLLLDLIVQKYSFSEIKKWLIRGFIFIILCFGIYDQTSANFVPDYKNTKEVFFNDDRFISNIETTFPNDSMVFQLPYIPFPEYPPVNSMTDYDHFRAYLHSNNIKWSYGAMKGRDGDLWQRNITNKPLDEMIHGLSFAGFNGIYVDCYGYKDNGNEILSSLSLMLEEKPLISDNQRLYFFDMTKYSNNLKSRYTPIEYEKEKNRILNYLRVEWRDGFSGLEGTKENNWRWCSQRGTLMIDNPSNEDIKFIISATFTSGFANLANLEIAGDLIIDTIKINNSGYNYKKEINVPPGKHVINFMCNANRVDAPADPRYLVFSVKNFKMVEIK